MNESKNDLSVAEIEAALVWVTAQMDNFVLPSGWLDNIRNAQDGEIFISLLAQRDSGYVRALPLLGEALELRTILELGNREGLSTTCFYGRLSKEGTFVTVDLVRDQRFCPKEMWSDPRVRFVFGDVCDLSIYGTSIPIDIDMLFLDTVHSYSQVCDEFSIYRPLLRQRAIIAIDDINLNDKRRFFDEWQGPKWDVTGDFHVSGFGLLLYESAEVLSTDERLRRAYAVSAEIWRRKASEFEVALGQATRVPHNTASYIWNSMISPRVNSRIARIKQLRDRVSRAVLGSRDSK